MDFESPKKKKKMAASLQRDGRIQKEGAGQGLSTEAAVRWREAGRGLQGAEEEARGSEGQDRRGSRLPCQLPWENHVSEGPSHYREPG